MEGYTTVSLPTELHDLVKKIIKENPELGYKSVAEVCKDGLREKIMEMMNNKRTLK
ncbi:MAG: ribbon-helix-helix domain-containing protein [Candidatus Thermoplasmatota archaeon]|nr:ribbon-helix-helix domain-containing protein [Candidatus Thermoplasmatota archaeon]